MYIHLYSLAGNGGLISNDRPLHGGPETDVT